MMRVFAVRQFAAVAIFAAVAALWAAARPDIVVRPVARAQTEPMPHEGDSADDPAIWIHPSRPEDSLVLGTDKQGALHVFDPSGKRLQTVGRDTSPNNVDVLYGMKVAGREDDIAVAGTRRSPTIGVKVFRIDPDTRALVDITAGGVLPVLGGGAPYGLCTYRSPTTGECYFFVDDYAGRVEQHLLTEAPGGMITARRVRAFSLGSITEGCVADNELGQLYLAQERVGIWRFNAEPDGGVNGKLIAKIGQNGLTADVEGLALYCAPEGKGYLIASSQGNHTFKVYRREGDNGFLLTIDPAKGDIDDVSDTDGIAVTGQPMGPRFPRGMFVAQDGRNAAGNQNFKFYAWEDVAGPHLGITPHPKLRY